MCRSRRELSNAYLLAKFGFDTAENEPCKVCPLSVYISPRWVVRGQEEARGYDHAPDAVPGAGQARAGEAAAGHDSRRAPGVWEDDACARHHQGERASNGRSSRA